MGSLVVRWRETAVRRRTWAAPRRGRRTWCEVLALEDRLAPAIFLQFDYSLDTNGFFANRPAAKTALEHAAAVVTGAITDDLTAIPASSASGPNVWDVVYFDPTTGDSVRKRGPSIPADTLVVYVGARRLQAGGSSELAEAAGGGYSAQFQSQSFFDNIVGRGHPEALGNNPTKYTPWGGSISFDLDSDWDFSINTIPAAGRPSFFQTAQHEIGHLLGVAASIPQFNRHVSNGAFAGPATLAVFGKPVPLDSVGSHWNTSVLYNGIVPTMIPFSRTDPPNIFTPLDYAALRDVGWSMPSSFVGGATFTAQATTASVSEGGNVVLKVDGSFTDGVHFVRVRTVDGTAKQGTNYQGVDKILVFQPWQKSQTLTIRTLADHKPTVDLGFDVELLYSQTNVSGSPAAVAFSVKNTDAGNRAPALDPIPAQTGAAGTLFTYQVVANDPDAGQSVTFSLGPGAPAGAAIDPATGLVSFTPPQASTVYQIPIVATDNGSPAASASAVLTLTTGGGDGGGVVDTSLALTASASNSSYGQAVRFTVVALSAGGAGTPTGTVTFLDGGTPIGQATLDGSGKAVLSISGLAPGSHNLSARYDGDAARRASASTSLGLVVSRNETTLSLTSSAPVSVFGEAVVFTARVDPTVPAAFAPTGTVTFFDNGKAIRTVPLFNGSATLIMTFTNLKGKHSFTAAYTGDGGFGGSKTPKGLAQKTVAGPTTVAIASTTRTGSAAKPSIRFVVAVAAGAPSSGIPSGNVTILVGGRRVGSGKLRNGSVAILVPLSKVAGKTATATFAGDSRFKAGRSEAFVVSV